VASRYTDWASPVHHRSRCKTHFAFDPASTRNETIVTNNIQLSSMQNNLDIA
jgi:hypothetical protein